MKNCPKCKNPMPWRNVKTKKPVCMFCAAAAISRKLAQQEREELVDVIAWVTAVPGKAAPVQMVTIDKTAKKAGWIPVVIRVAAKHL